MYLYIYANNLYVLYLSKFLPDGGYILTNTVLLKTPDESDNAYTADVDLNIHDKTKNISTFSRSVQKTKE